ncbi:MAG: Na+/H+ antiporter NhaA [Holosporales bacterium]|jgi:NhaA family Na+:H+ antiporter
MLSTFLKRFFAMEAAGGLIMLGAAGLAIVLANSPVSLIYKDNVTPIMPFVKDILMVLFFLSVGLELKRETREGFLQHKTQVILPLLTALGGMVVPALVFLYVTRNMPELASGWAIPAATDIAFALCVLGLVGKGVPPAAKVFLLALAIFDDLGAIIVVALFYSHGIVPLSLLAGAGVVGGLILLNKRGVGAISPYMLLGIALWFCLHHGGVHTTVAGVVVGLLVPMRMGEHSPAERALELLHPWVSFLILPLFAFVSAGVDVRGLGIDDLTHPLPLGIALGLFVGKQVGIMGIAWLSIRGGLATLPEGTTWRHLYGISILAGIGFTMSLFIGNLAFAGAWQNPIILGVVAGSLLSSIWGWAVLRGAGGVRPQGLK